MSASCRAESFKPELTSYGEVVAKPERDQEISIVVIRGAAGVTVWLNSASCRYEGRLRNYGVSSDEDEEVRNEKEEAGS